MAIKRSELYRSLWRSCDELRGGMDTSQYKDYVLILLFIKCISDKYASQELPLIDVPTGSSFRDMVALIGDKEIGDKINKQIIAPIAKVNNLKDVIDVADFNDEDKLGKGKEMQDRLSNLISIFNNPALDFRKNRAEDDDLLGDAYEYLMRHFATELGKSKGQFYTPAEVSRVMAKVISIDKAQSQYQTLYDPTCGSGTLLLKAANESKGITIYGQEMDKATYVLARMNMILHGYPDAAIWHDNSLARPYFKQNGRNDLEDHNLRAFDFVVAHPPFSNKAWSNGFDADHDFYQRFVDGVPPRRNGDYAFLLHIIRSLKSTGKGAVILPHGVLFRRNSEAEIRRKIIHKGYIKGIIGLPPNLFYGTGIPACIIVLDKENAVSRAGIFMIDASKGFIKDGNKNRLRHQDIRKIVDVFTRQLELPGYARMVSLAEIEANDFNLNIPLYIDSSEPEDLPDIAAHSPGDIPERDIDALAAYWQVFPTLKQQLFVSGLRAGYSEISVELAQIEPTISSHPEFVVYTGTVTALLEEWRINNVPTLKNFGVGSHPKGLIEILSEDILRVFASVQLIDKYDICQHLMSYWSEVMQDDVYMIAQDGWLANRDLIPPPLIIKRYFASEQRQIEKLEVARDEILRKLDALEEEHGGEGGLLEEVKNEKGKITKTSMMALLREIVAEVDTEDEHLMLNTFLDLLNQEAEASKKVRTAQKTLDAMVEAQYKRLSEDEVKMLVVDDKWLATLAADVQTELNRVSLVLTKHVKKLAERYDVAISKQIDNAHFAKAKVSGKLVFIEDTNIEVLKGFDKALGTDCFQGFNAIPHISGGGKDNQAPYYSMNTLKAYTRQNIEVHFIVDGDAMPDKWRKYFQRRAKDKFTLHQLIRHEIENYLINPDLLVRALKMKYPRKEIPDVEEFKSVLTDIMKQTIISPRAYFKDHIKSWLEQLILNKEIKELVLDKETGQEKEVIKRYGKDDVEREARDIADEYYDCSDFDQLFIVAPGKEVFKELNKWLNKHININISINEVVRCIRQEDVPNEIRQILTQLRLHSV